MSAFIGNNKVIGVLGAGQLGRMLATAAAPWNLTLHMLDPTPDAPASTLCSEFVPGDFRDKQTVLDFGEQCDVLTIEIEQVNVEALEELESRGKQVHPRPGALKIIQDKGLQKQFFEKHGLPSAPYALFANVDEVKAADLTFPCVQKVRTEGYDGRGVVMLQTKEDEDRLLKGPCLIEDAVDVDTEIAVIAVRNPDGQVTSFDPVEMSFHPEANLVEFLAAPARIPPDIASQAKVLAEKTICAFDVCGVLAVEMFLNKSGELLLNEVAPRPHNSGHHTIEACVSSQYEQHLRGILNQPLGDCRLRQPAVMVNVLGEEGKSGPAVYEGLRSVLETSGAYLHIYGKKETRPFRKMGHLTLCQDELETAITLAQRLQNHLKVTAL